MDATSTLDLALLLLRVGAGLGLAAHGSQKLFGWFGGGGLRGTAAAFDSLGFRPGRVTAALAGLAETTGGLLLALGFLTPLTGAVVVATMLTAASVHKRTFFALDNGVELPAFYALAGVVLAIGGPGGYSVDALLGHPLHQTWIPFTALGVAVLLAVAGAVGRRSVLRVEAESTGVA